MKIFIVPTEKGKTMKITFDIPDGTMCAFLNFVFREGYNVNMGVKQAGTEELNDGAVLVYNPEDAEHEQ